MTGDKNKNRKGWMKVDEKDRRRWDGTIVSSTSDTWFLCGETNLSGEQVIALLLYININLANNTVLQLYEGK